MSVLGVKKKKTGLTFLEVISFPHAPLSWCVGRVTNLRRVTYVVLDEADRMFDMGFEPQVGVSQIYVSIHCVTILPVSVTFNFMLPSKAEIHKLTKVTKY